jgi:hypothetical protein
MHRNNKDKTRKSCNVLFSLFLLLASSGIAQNTSKYWVFFKDKPETKFDPYAYFDAKAIERRINQHLPLFDWTDLPVNENYITQVKANCAVYKMHSRWFNAAVVMASPEQAQQLSALPGVDHIEEAAPLQLEVASMELVESALHADEDEDILISQTKRMGAELFAEKGYTGKGIRIAIFDVGFSGADEHAAFQHIRSRNGILKTWDFVKKEENVWKGGWHGTAVWSCIAGVINGRNAGLASDAEFLLARTEIGSKEPFAEEEYWVAAAEWADKNGADLVNSSLGYTDSRYFPRQMDGKTTYISRGANIAARKGLLIVNAAGNEGSSSWRIIGAPADADSVLSIGGVEPCCDYHISFSSYGPTRDGRLKPNVCAQGRAFCAKEAGVSAADGTSFASPLAAGFAACAWQAKRTLTNMQLFDALEKSGNLYPYYDYAHGYGVLSADRFLNGITSDPTFSFTKASIEEGTIKDDSTTSTSYTSIEVIVSDTSDLNNESLMYYSIMNDKGGLDSYYVIKVSQYNPISFPTGNYATGSILRVSYKGYTSEYTF